jgi:hypothetical protein
MKYGLHTLIILCSLACLIFPYETEADLAGYICTDCHTMHNSQNTQTMSFDGSPDPFKALLRGSCEGCHTSTAAGTWQSSIANAPIVYNTVEPTYSAKGLAAGNFYYVSSTDDDKGHNIFVSNPDGAIGNVPPGGTDLGQQISCSGTYGCHGHNGRQSGDTAIADQTKSIMGGHHGVNAPMDGSITEVSKSYRFLLGIKGVEDADWEHDNVNTSHNEYQGSTAGTTDTMSYFCAECHGNFHTWTGGVFEVGNASPWLRHPTDVAVPIVGEYSNIDTYSMLAPVARPTPDTVLDTTLVYRGSDMIMCLSCHRSHASPYYKMLRWDYKNTTLSTALSGCNVCHITKD